MGKIVYGMLASLDAYIAGPPGGKELPAPSDELHWHFTTSSRPPPSASTAGASTR